MLMMSDNFLMTGQQPEQNDLLRTSQRILAVKLYDSGDVVMLSPVLRALKEALPLAGVTLMTSTAGSRVTPLLPWIDDVVVCSVRGTKPSQMWFVQSAAPAAYNRQNYTPGRELLGYPINTQTQEQISSPLTEKLL